MEIRTLLVDDEYLAMNLLEGYLKRSGGFKIVGKLESPIEAMQLMNSQAIDLLFLDIQMPEISGPNMLRALPKPPVTIFTTAYDSYALEAFDLNVVDYLCKPFSFERFVQALDKARLILDPEQSDAPQPSAPRNFITLKNEGKWTKVSHDEIIYIKGLREYVKIFTTAGNFVVLRTMKNLSEELPDEKFIRIHKSYIASLDHIRSLEGNSLIVGGEALPLSRDRKKEILARIFQP